MEGDHFDDVGVEIHLSELLTKVARSNAATVFINQLNETVVGGRNEVVLGPLLVFNGCWRSSVF